MGFSNDIKKFTEKAKKELEVKRKEAEENAEVVLRELLGDDMLLIEEITLDTDVGKFYNVVAPQIVLDKLQEANLLKF